MVTIKVTPKLEPVVEHESEHSQSLGYDTPQSYDENDYMEVDTPRTVQARSYERVKADLDAKREGRDIDAVKADLEEAMREGRDIDAPSSAHNATSVASPVPDQAEASPSPDYTMGDGLDSAVLDDDDEYVDDTQMHF